MRHNPSPGSPRKPQNATQQLRVAWVWSNIIPLIFSGVSEYLALRGVISTGLARIILFTVWSLGAIGIGLSEWFWGEGIRRRILRGAGISVALALVLILIDLGVTRITSHATTPVVNALSNPAISSNTAGPPQSKSRSTPTPRNEQPEKKAPGSSVAASITVSGDVSQSNSGGCNQLAIGNNNTNNCTPPPPNVVDLHLSALAAEEKPAVRREGDAAHRPGAEATFSVDGIFPNAMFVIVCDRPCQATNLMVRSAAFSLQLLDTNGPSIAVAVVGSAAPLVPGQLIFLRVRSLDDRAVAIVSVSGYVQSSPVHR